VPSQEVCWLLLRRTRQKNYCERRGGKNISRTAAACVSSFLSLDSRISREKQPEQLLAQMVALGRKLSKTEKRRQDQTACFDEESMRKRIQI
jgi:hypothetical protein